MREFCASAVVAAATRARQSAIARMSHLLSSALSDSHGSQLEPHDLLRESKWTPRASVTAPKDGREQHVRSHAAPPIEDCRSNYPSDPPLGQRHNVRWKPLNCKALD